MQLGTGNYSICRLAEGLRSEVRGPRSEIRGPRSEIRGPRSEIRGPRAEIRGPRSEIRGPRSRGAELGCGVRRNFSARSAGYVSLLWLPPSGGDRAPMDSNQSRDPSVQADIMHSALQDIRYAVR